MEQKDPKDMTAAELLRWAAENDKLRMRCDMCMKLYMMDGCGGHDCNDWLNDLADKIEADLAKARRGGLERCAKSWAEANGWPGFREGEGFGEWVNRCWLPIPRYEGGEPVDESDFGEDACLTVYGDGDWLINCSDGGQIEGSRSQRVERPAPEALGADGLPIVEGDVVYELGKDEALTVYEVNAQYIHAKKESGAAWSNLTAEYLTHTHPDTQKRIDGDSQKTADAYWGCIDVSCEDCPAKIDDKRPWERCYANNCVQAQILDLLRRQRELDKRTGGE